MAVWDLFLDLLFPVICQDCGLEGQYLCTPCQTKIKPPWPRCLKCDKPSLAGSVHEACRSETLALSGLMVASNYENEAVRKLIWHLKYRSMQDIGQVLGMLLADYFVEQDFLDYFAGALVVPVPLHQSRLRERGFNQAELVARDFAKRLSLECQPILRKVRKTKNQVDLEKRERLQNMMNAFSLISPLGLEERKIILIDDVATTGTTLNECAKVLRSAGAGEIWGLVVARNKN